MKYTLIDIETEIRKLSERIINIFKTEPYSVSLYSKILQDILLTFIELRLNKLLSRFDTKPEINIEVYDKDNSIDLLYKDRTKTAEDDQSLEWILSELIPESFNLINGKQYKEGKLSFDNVLNKFKTDYGVTISKMDLINYQHIKNYVELSDSICNKYKKLLSVLLTINKSFNSSDDSGIIETNLPENDFKMILVNNGNKLIDVNKVFYHRETNFIIQLHRILEENGGLIKSLYQFPNREKEIQNIRQYPKTNDLFMFDLIKTNFMLFKNGKRIDNDKDTRLEFLKKIRLNEPVDITITNMQVYLNRLRKRKENYLSSDIRDKLQEAFEKWLYHPSISEWEDYWFNKKKGYIQNELQTAKNINFEKDKANKKLRSALNDSKPSSENNYKFLKKGEYWLIIFNGNKKIIGDLKGMKFIDICLHNPQKLYKYETLAQAIEIEDVKNATAKIDIKLLYKELDLLKKECDILSDIDIPGSEISAEKCAEIETIEDAIKSKQDDINRYYEYSKYEPNYSIKAKLSRNILKNIRTCMSRIKINFPEFHQHLKTYLKIYQGVMYDSNIDWK